MNRSNKVLLIYTGGTIGMGINPRTGALEPLDFNHLVSNIPEFDYLQTDVSVYQFTPPIDSSDMNPVISSIYISAGAKYNSIFCISFKYSS